MKSIYKICNISKQEEFETLCGGVKQAARLLSMWDNMESCKTYSSFLFGVDKTREKAFETKAKMEGFSQEMIDAFFKNL